MKNRHETTGAAARAFALVAALVLSLGTACEALSRPRCVDLNTATAAELQGIRHVGAERARQIIALRVEQPFTSVDELRRVEGIGDARLREIVAEGRACVPQPDSAGGASGS